MSGASINPFQVLNELQCAKNARDRLEDTVKNLLTGIKDLRTTDQLNHDPPAVLKAHNTAVNTLKGIAHGVPYDV